METDCKDYNPNVIFWGKNCKFAMIEKLKKKD